MKKSALLAVSALSLGVVGLATFTPLTYAATTQDVTITVTVEGQIGIGNEDGSALTGMDVNYTLSANDVKQDQTRTIKTTNNTNNDLTLTVKSKEGDASLTGANPENKIPAGTNIAAGTSAWGIKGGNLSNWTAVPAESAGGLMLLSRLIHIRTLLPILSRNNSQLIGRPSHIGRPSELSSINNWKGSGVDE